MPAEARSVANREDGCWTGCARAARYDREVNRRFYESALGRLLRGAPELSGQGLDLGCGTGFSTEVLLARQPRVRWQGVDCSTAMLAVARAKPGLSRIALHAARAEALPFADATFDVVVASFAWHWFGEGAAREVRRVLRPRGWLLATVPVRHRSPARGNRALARALLAGRHRFVPRTSQGLRMTDLAGLLPSPARVAHQELVIERERFTDAQEMLDVLDSRGALAAIFGSEPPTSLVVPSPVDFEWPFAVLHVQA